MQQKRVRFRIFAYACNIYRIMSIYLRMKPNNEFTSPEARFFYPVNHGVEYHESLDTTSVPGTENIPGKNHYAVVENEAGEVYAAELGWGNSNIPVNATVLGIKGQKKEADVKNIDRRFLRKEEFECFDEECSYTPDEEEGTHIIVQADLSRFYEDISDSRFDRRGVAILPYGEPLPSFKADGVPDEQVRYQLLGFINPNDKLVSWHGETGYATLLVDWCVANRLKQNRLEEALLHDALPQGGHLVGMLSTREAAKAYLQYFDNKHGTVYLPEEDPRYPYSESKFPPLSEDDYKTYRKLADLAHHFINRPR
jgi:hypothetical protein